MVIDIQKYWGDREIFHPIELASKIIQSMQQHGSVKLFSKECRAGRHSGLFQLLDELCSTWNWDPAKITLITTNIWENHALYTVQKICHVFWATHLEFTLGSYIDSPAWDGSKIYGMFLGRATTERIRGVVRHKNFEFQNLGLTSFHHDLQHQIDTPELLEYLCETDDRFSEILQIRPYSDIGKIYKPPITSPMDTNWKNTYQQIAIELVFETSTAEDCAVYSEKFIRPILFGRPFMMIAGRHYIKKFKDIDFMREAFEPIKEYQDANLIDQICQKVTDFRYFENIFGSDYDNDAGVHRVDHVFDILGTLIRNGSVNTVLEKCQKDIEHNQQLVYELLPLYKQLNLQHTKYYDRSTWPK